MPRNSHTISGFKGVDYTSAINRIPPSSAIDSLNVYGDAGGFLSQFQTPTPLLDWSDPANAATDLAATLSMGQLPSPSAHPRLIIQQGNRIMRADYPYSAAILFGHGDLSGIAARLDHAYCNGLLYFSNGQDSGYVLPAPAATAISRNKWGISPPPAPTLVLASTAWVPGSITTQRTAGVTTITFAAPHGAAPGQPCFVDSAPSAPWPVSMQGAWKIATVPSPTTLTFLQPGLPNVGPFTRATYPSGITATTGWQYGACYASSPVGHFSSLSPISANTGPVTSQSPTILIAPTSDWQVDSAAIFRNQDGVVVGGGLWYLEDNLTLIDAGDYTGYAVYCDTQTDEVLATSGQTAPYDNGVAPNGKYVAVWLDRVLMCGILDNPTAVRFTGYDTINLGRPQMSWCQFNEIKLGQGQATPLGMGLLRYGGMVFFATNGFMYIYRGSLNDISISAPVSLSFYAEQMPYQIGLYSHFSIQSTPAGLVWLDDGFNLRTMDNTGFYPPKLLAPNLTGLFKRITPGSQDKVTSAYVNHLQRDWYILSFPVDGSLVNNMTVVIDVSADPAHNTGAWPVDHSITDMVWVLYPDGTQHLIASQPQLTSDVAPPTAGYITEIPLISPLTQGLADPNAAALAPPNPPMPGAYWRGGYFGIMDEQQEDEYSMMKMFRYLRFSGSVMDGVRIQAFIVDGEDRTFDNPEIQDLDMEEAMAGVNNKGRCLSPLIIFPSNTLATITSLMLAWRETGER